MEVQLQRAVVVTVAGARPQVGIVEASRLLQAVFNLGPEDMSIRPFSPEDFLVLCREVRVRDRMVAAGIAQGSAFSLALRGWIRQAHAMAVDLPFLLPLELKGVPAHAWTRRTADVLLDGVGFVVDVDAPTARREDMSSFRVWVRALDPSRVPSSRPLFVEEPPAPEVRPRGRHRGPPPSRRAKTLRYDVRFHPLVEAVLADEADSPPRPSRRPLRRGRHRLPRHHSRQTTMRALLAAAGAAASLHLRRYPRPTVAIGRTRAAPPWLAAI
jgi:hypothetical protein